MLYSSFKQNSLVLHLLFMRAWATEGYLDREAILMTGSLHLDQLESCFVICQWETRNYWH